jgi:two-component system, NtrC family, response regulator AtoC
MPLSESRTRILVVDDEEDIRAQFGILLGDDHDIREAADGAACLKILERESVDLILLDQVLPGMSGLDLLHIIRQRWADIQVLMVSGLTDTTTAVKAMKAGAFYYVTKGGDPAELRQLVRAALEPKLLRRQMLQLQDELEESRREFVMSRNPRMRAIDAIVAKVAKLPTTVLIEGESGTGKEVIARQIFQAGGSERPFVRVNMASIPRELIESMLFGHERGAFTGAVRQQPGKFELASGGVLFMDEIGELPLDMQTKLLRVIQEGEFERVGGLTTLEANVRLIAATNKDLHKAVANGEFREDLYYRLNVVPIYLPPLRERPEDIQALASHFVRKYAHRFAGGERRLTPEALKLLEGYPWPGNIRELENLMERLVATSETPQLEVGHIPFEYHSASPISSNGNRLQSATEAFERDFLLKALQQCEGSPTETARFLGIPLSTLKYKLKRSGLNGRKLARLARM